MGLEQFVCLFCLYLNFEQYQVLSVDGFLESITTSPVFMFVVLLHFACQICKAVNLPSSVERIIFFKIPGH